MVIHLKSGTQVCRVLAFGVFGLSAGGFDRSTSQFHENGIAMTSSSRMKNGRSLLNHSNSFNRWLAKSWLRTYLETFSNSSTIILGQFAWRRILFAPNKLTHRIIPEESTIFFRSSPKEIFSSTYSNLGVLSWNIVQSNKRFHKQGWFLFHSTWYNGDSYVSVLWVLSYEITTD